ncbi:HLA class I histocompatibility antigen, A-74 alpha chain-like [Alligator sinensis]|uniref:HLA class I histocompatibility antigen, A-74 alpha chain-like n=1 Tax=Alligator sinensis TaxID=38654 RepID=A0A3Q0FTU5_ALLSI|nr:HLA class I histocompatibility antigen, A-74 alpha chain-like [Alligator sinensis]
MVASGSQLLLLLLLLGAAAVPGASAGCHSYRHFYTGVTDPGWDVPDFTAMGYVDDQHILHYDSETQRQEPRGDWVQGAVGPYFGDTETMRLRGWQDRFKRNLLTLRHRYNQTRGECEQAGVGRRPRGLGDWVTDEGIGEAPAH